MARLGFAQVVSKQDFPLRLTTCNHFKIVVGCGGRGMDLFGSADGGSEGAHGFVHFDEKWGDLSLRLTDRRIRVLVGRRGSGKSRYLRALERDAEHSDGDHRMLVFPQRDDSVWIEEMRWLHSMYPEPHERIEVWRKLWGCAIYASLASYLLNFVPPSGTSINISSDDRDYLSKVCVDQLDRASVCYPIVAVLNQFLNRYQDRGRLHAFVSDGVWTEIEDRVLKAIAVSTPIACYVDTLDESFASSPAAATDCQVGLLQWIFRKFNDPHVSNRVHVVVAIRDTVFARFMQGEHSSRYHRSDSFRCLDWSDEAATYFLHEKISQLPVTARVSPREKSDPIRSWLGFDEVPNEMREGVRERVADLIVRHTRFLPREIIEIGNVVGRYVARRVSANEPVLPETIPPLVMDEARRLSDGALATAANHMVALDQDHARTVVNNGFGKTVIQAINNQFIPALEDERFTRDALMFAEEMFAEAVGGWKPMAGGKAISLGQMLWLHGLIGYEENAGPRPIAKFFSSTRSLKANYSSDLPEADHYYLHAALLRPSRTNIGPLPPIVEAADE